MEITATTLQTVTTNQNVLFTDTVVPCGCSMIHRNGSGLVTLRATGCNQSRARFRVLFSGNIGLPTGATAAAISVSISLDGEPVPSSRMISTPTAAAQYNNVSGAIFIEVPKGCCATVAIKNTSTQSINVQDANLIVERVA